MSWTDGDEADLRRSVRCLQRVPVIRHPRGRLRAQTARLPETRRELVVGIAASTGGPAALATVLSGLAGLDAPVLVVQHLHADFTGGLATWMRRVSALPVEVAVHDQPLLPGHVYLSPGGVHLQLGSDRRIVLSRHPDGLHRPSADQLFLSMADRAGRDGIGVVLTGMGEDGARGLLALANRGGRIIGQDEATCAVFGMPRAANRLGAVQDLLPIDAIAGAIRRLGAERP